MGRGGLRESCPAGGKRWASGAISLAARRPVEINYVRCMKTSTIKITCLLTAGSLLISAPITHAQIPYVPLPFNHSSTAENVVTAVVIAATIYFIARYEATEHQRQV